MIFVLKNTEQCKCHLLYWLVWIFIIYQRLSGLPNRYTFFHWYKSWNIKVLMIQILEMAMLLAGMVTISLCPWMPFSVYVLWVDREDTAPISLCNDVNLIRSETYPYIIYLKYFLDAPF